MSAISLKLNFSFVGFFVGFFFLEMGGGLLGGLGGGGGGWGLGLFVFRFVLVFLNNHLIYVLSLWPYHNLHFFFHAHVHHVPFHVSKNSNLAVMRYLIWWIKIHLINCVAFMSHATRRKCINSLYKYRKLPQSRFYSFKIG